MRWALGGLLWLSLAPSLWACEVWVNGYVRRDGTYVEGHCRSAPDGQRWNNYGPSHSPLEYTNPFLRDHDGDGFSNQFDMDDDDDGLLDEFDADQYGEEE